MMRTIVEGFWHLFQNWKAPLNAPGSCPGCGHANDVWQDEMIRDGYVVTRVWLGCPNKRRAFGQHDLDEADRHYAKWTESNRRPLHE